MLILQDLQGQSMMQGQYLTDIHRKLEGLVVQLVEVQVLLIHKWHPTNE